PHGRRHLRGRPRDRARHVQGRGALDGVRRAPQRRRLRRHRRPRRAAPGDGAPLGRLAARLSPPRARRRGALRAARLRVLRRARLRSPRGAARALEEIDVTRGTKRWLVAGAVLVFATGLVLHARVFDFFCDDAFITLRYSKNFATTGSPIYNFGEKVEGYTS